MNHRKSLRTLFFNKHTTCLRRLVGNCQGIAASSPSFPVPKMGQTPPKHPCHTPRAGSSHRVPRNAKLHVKSDRIWECLDFPHKEVRIRFDGIWACLDARNSAIECRIGMSASYTKQKCTSDLMEFGYVGIPATSEMGGRRRGRKGKIESFPK